MSVAAIKPPHEPPPEFPARKFVTLPQPLRLYRGGSIARPVVAYESWGTRNANDDNTVLLFTGLSPSAHAASSALDPAPGWWESMIGEDRPIDTRRWHVVCVNSLGSPFGSSSASLAGGNASGRSDRESQRSDAMLSTECALRRARRSTSRCDKGHARRARPYTHRRGASLARETS